MRARSSGVAVRRIRRAAARRTRDPDRWIDLRLQRCAKARLTNRSRLRARLEIGTRAAHERMITTLECTGHDRSMRARAGRRRELFQAPRGVSALWTGKDDEIKLIGLAGPHVVH